MDGDDVLDEHVAARAIESHTNLGTILGIPVGRDVDRILHIEERWHLTRRHQTHGVLIEQAVSLDRRDGAERAAAEIQLTPDDIREIDEARLDVRGARLSDASQRLIDR